MNLTGFRTSLRPNTFVAETKSSSEEGTSGPRWPPWMPYLMKQAIPKYQVALFIYRLAHEVRAVSRLFGVSGLFSFRYALLSFKQLGPLNVGPITLSMPSSDSCLPTFAGLRSTSATTSSAASSLVMRYPTASVSLMARISILNMPHSAYKDGWILPQRQGTLRVQHCSRCGRYEAYSLPGIGGSAHPPVISVFRGQRDSISIQTISLMMGNRS